MSSPIADRINRALAHLAAGECDTARGLFDAVLDELAESDQTASLRVDLLTARGGCAQACDDTSAAMADFEAALTLHLSLQPQGALDDAGVADEYGGDPKVLDLLAQLGGAALAAGDMQRAEAAFSRAVSMNMEDVDCWNGLGLVLRTTGRVADAQMAHRKAVTVRADSVDGWNGLAACSLTLGQYTQALSHARRALSITPDHADALNNAGVAAKGLGHLDEARDYFLAALQQGEDAATLGNLGNVEREAGYTDEAYAHYLAALEAAPAPEQAAIRAVLATVMPVIATDTAQTERWREHMARTLDLLQRDAQADPALHIADPHAQVGYTTFHLAYHGHDDRPLQEAYATTLRTLCPELCPDLCHTASHTRIAYDRPRIRIAFVSSFLHGHTIAKLFGAFITGLPRERFEVCIARPEGRDDATSRALEAACDIRVRFPDDLRAARTAIEELQADVIFYTDIGMDSLTYWLAHARLAPVQATTWGHPVTTGLPTMDWFYSCEAMEPDGADACYTEQLYRATRLNTCFARPTTRADSPPLDDAERAALGLPSAADGPLYVCLQSLFKLHPDYDAALVALCAEDPRARVAFVRGAHPHWEKLLRTRWERTWPGHCDHAVFVDRQDQQGFWRLAATADCVLDTFPFCGGTTTLECLAVGAPVVTLPTQLARGRISAAIYAQAGVHDLTATDVDDWARRAARVANDADFRQDVCTRLEQAAGEIFNDTKAVDEFAAFVEHVWATHPTNA